MKKGIKKEPLERLKDIKLSHNEDYSSAADFSKNSDKLSSSWYMTCKAAVDQYVEDQAVLQRRSVKHIKDDLLILSLFTGDELVDDAIAQMYQPDYGVGAAVGTIFNELAASTLDVDPDRYKPLIEYAFDTITGISPDFDQSTLEFLAKDLELLVKNAGPEKYIPQIRDTDDVTFFTFQAIYAFLYWHWQHLSTSRYSYRLLSAMAYMQTWEDNIATRNELLSILYHIAK